MYDVTLEHQLGQWDFVRNGKSLNYPLIAEYITFARNWESGESVIYFYILVPRNLTENDHNFMFVGYKVTN